MKLLRCLTTIALLPILGILVVFSVCVDGSADVAEGLLRKIWGEG
jgi:hypothetical protein